MNKISIIIPCRNEEKYIGKCLDSVFHQDYTGRMEVLVIDGMSEDKTREIIKEYPPVKLLDNPKRFTPFALNIGIKNAKGNIIIRMDAHAEYKSDYISKCVKYLKEYKADNVGGIRKTRPSRNTIWAKAIAICYFHPFGVGSDFRLRADKPKEADTVYGGCYWRKLFDKIGLYNENLIRSQDLEFNLRLKAHGGKIILFPDIVSYYYPDSTLKDFFLHNFKDGMWAILPLRHIKIPFKLRHYIPLIFILTLPLSVIPYLLVNLFFSAGISIKEKDIRYLFMMLLTFMARHIGYGLGSLWGLVKLL